MFDSEGYSNVVEDSASVLVTAPILLARAARRIKNQLPNQSLRLAKSRLTESHTPDSMVCNMTPGDAAAGLYTQEVAVKELKALRLIQVRKVVKTCKDGDYGRRRIGQPELQ